MSDKFVIGQLFDSKCKLLEFVGAGSSGIVFKARQLDCDRIIAIKIFNKEISADAKQIERFRREAKALSKLSHENIVKVLYMGKAEDEQYFLAMEYISGSSLTSVLANDKIDFSTACGITKDLAAALAYVHENNIVHRDIKPSNIILADTSTGPIPQLIDFGLATTQLVGSGQRLTSSGAIMGTPQYMSPEQCAGKIADARSDIYALCVCFYEMLAQKRLFEANSAVGIMYEHLNAEVPQLPRGAFGAHNNQLNKILQCGLAKNPDDRFQSMNELYNSISAMQDLFLDEKESGISKHQDSASAPKSSAKRFLLIIVFAVFVAAFAGGLSNLRNHRQPANSYLIAKPSTSSSETNAREALSKLAREFIEGTEDFNGPNAEQRLNEVSNIIEKNKALRAPILYAAYIFKNELQKKTGASTAAQIDSLRNALRYSTLAGQETRETGRVYESMANLQSGIGHTAEAIKLYERSAQLFANQQTPSLNIPASLKVTKNIFTEVDCYLALAKLNEASKHYDQALKYYDCACSQNVNPHWKVEAYVNRIRTLRSLGRKLEAERCVHEFISTAHGIVVAAPGISLINANSRENAVSALDSFAKRLKDFGFNDLAKMVFSAYQHIKETQKSTLLKETD